MNATGQVVGWKSIAKNQRNHGEPELAGVIESMVAAMERLQAENERLRAALSLSADRLDQMTDSLDMARRVVRTADSLLQNRNVWTDEIYKIGRSDYDALSEATAKYDAIIAPTPEGE